MRAPIERGDGELRPETAVGNRVPTPWAANRHSFDISVVIAHHTG